MRDYKKQELELMFEVFQDMYDDRLIKSDKWERLYTCKAWIANELYMGEHMEVLRSYETIVAVYVPSTQKVYQRGFYSNTTCQHCAKFTRWCREKYGKYTSGEKLWAIGERIRVDRIK